MGFLFKVIIICFLTYYITESWFAVFFVGFITSLTSSPDEVLDEKMTEANKVKKARMDRVGASDMTETYIFEILDKIFRRPR